MTDFDDTNTGVLFKSENKKTPKSPDYFGRVTLEGGREMELAGWVRESKKDGRKFISFVLKEPYEKRESSPADQYYQPTQEPDEVPF